MADKEHYEALKPVFSQLTGDAVGRSDMPVEIFLQEASDLHVWA